MAATFAPSLATLMERKTETPISGSIALQKNKKPQALYCLRWSGGRAPRVICAPTFVPPFSSLHPSTLVSTVSVWVLPQNPAIGP